ncbi:MAG: hypothetical protein JSS74_12690 [Actinobacteria bacterium]|nr:hypothetical protein [Actinomycetota bacterium]
MDESVPPGEDQNLDAAMRLLSPDGPLVVTMRIVAMSIVALIGLSCLYVAIFLDVSAPPWVLFASGVLFLVGAFGQLWRLFTNEGVALV